MNESDIDRITNVLNGIPPNEKLRKRYDTWQRAWNRASKSGPLPAELLIVLASEMLEGPLEEKAKTGWTPKKGDEVMFGDNGMQRRGTFGGRGPGGKYWIQPPGADDRVLCHKDTVSPLNG